MTSVSFKLYCILFYCLLIVVISVSASKSWCGWTDWRCHTEVNLTCTLYRERYCLCDSSHSTNKTSCFGPWRQVVPAQNTSLRGAPAHFQCDLIAGRCIGTTARWFHTDGKWCGWLRWTGCNTCQGSQTRTRLCLCPSQRAGRDCPGSNIEYRSCSFDKHCANWCSWSSWSTCPRLRKWCDDPHITRRHRNCSCPAVQVDGITCPGFSHEMRSCRCFRHELSAPYIALLATTCLAFFGSYVICFIFRVKNGNNILRRRFVLRMRTRTVDDPTTEDNTFPPPYHASIGENWPAQSPDLEKPPDYEEVNEPISNYETAVNEGNAAAAAAATTTSEPAVASLDGKESVDLFVGQSNPAYQQD